MGEGVEVGELPGEEEGEEGEGREGGDLDLVRVVGGRGGGEVDVWEVKGWEGARWERDRW